jgi:hypothetical protein
VTDVTSGPLDITDQFADKFWRLTNLYNIINESGEEVHFVPNEMQLKFLDEMWYLNCILKARQHGFTTLITLWILDECLFYPNQTAGVIAHNLEDGAKIFRTKIKHPYDRLLPGLRDRIPAQNDRAQELVFGNKSSIAVSTSTRSGTCQYLLITEFGKIAAKFPEKANEIVSGAFNTVHPGNYLFVESSAEGRSGQFYDLCKRSEDAKVAEKPLSKMDFKFHFYSWWENPKYVLSAEDAKNVVFTKAHHEYFDKLARQHGIKLTFEQMAFYIKKREMNGGDLIKREYPSTSKEAFEASIIGAYFGEQMAEAREKGRICKVPHVKGVGVDTWWDLGLRDKMAVWFVQVVGREARFINYTEKSDRSLTWFLTVHLPAIQKEHGYHYRNFVGPHDLSVRELTSGVARWQTAKGLGVLFKVCPQIEFEDQLEEGRNFIAGSWFDEEMCAEGVEHLENFRKEWNEHLGAYMDKPMHDKHSHGASAYMTGACMFRTVNQGGTRAQRVGARRFAT